MKVVHNKPNSNQKSELLFQHKLLSKLSNFTHKNETYQLDKTEFINPFVDVRKVEKAIANSRYISQKKKIALIDILNKLPEKVKAAEKHSLISVDFVLVDENNIKHYIEFHEKQHRDLSVSRLTHVCDEFENRYVIPRFAQRLLKDVWRFENLPNYKIVWFDWFEKNPNYEVEEFLSLGNNEFFIENKFSFWNLLK